MSGPRRSELAVGVVLGVITAVAVTIVAVTVDDGGGGGLMVEDGTGDCREPGRDIGFACDPGAEVLAVSVAREQDRMLVEVELDAAPILGPDRTWTVQFNAAAVVGKVCGISNVVEDGVATDSAVGYGYDPAFGLSELTRRALPEGVCTAELDGATVRFTVDMHDQPPAEPFRVVGFSTVEFPADDERPGSEDDFGFDASMAGL